MRDRLIEALFSLFTSADRAEAIAGDLTEERARHGGTWFWLHVARVTCALWRGSAAEAPARVAALAVAGCAIFIAPAFAGAAAVSLFPQWMGSPASWIALSLFWWGGALLTGALLVVIAPRRGMAACATLAIVAATLLCALGVTALAHDTWTPAFLLFYTTGLAAGAPLLIGAAMARRRMLSLLCVLVAVAVAVPAPASSQPVAWKDPSPHAARLVTVEENVQLEVLDWGGSGPALVLLAGLGDTAHVFDDFAPMLTARYRVLGVTRRGHGRSSAPADGYGFSRLAEDVVRVIDAEGIRKPVVVGHSMAGEELHVLGARHAAKIAGVVYVDAAFNRADGSEEYDAAARALPPAPRPAPGDQASFAALRAFLERTQGAAGPEAHLRARYVANADGSIARPWAPPPPIFQAMSRKMQAAFKTYKPEPIQVPALAVYAVPKSANDLMRPWYAADDAAVRDGIQTLFRRARERFDRHAAWFGTFAPRGRVSELPGAHHLFLTHPRDLLQLIDGFLSSLRAPDVSRDDQ